MAVAVQDDWAADGGGGSTVNVTFTAGSNLCAFAFVQFTTGTVTGVTINSVSMTEIGSKVTNGVRIEQMFALPSPPTGTNSMVVTGATGVVEISWISFTGVDQTNPVDNANTSFATAGAITATITNVVSAGCWMIGMGGFAGGNMTGASGDFGTMFPAPSTEPASLRSNSTIGTGSQTGSFTTSGSSVTPIIFIAAVNPAGAGGATAKNLSLLGVGT